jgi:penicillin amidase
MFRKVQRIFVILLNVLVALSVLFGVFGIVIVRRSFPKTKGEIRLEGLNTPVEVYRDSDGVPHIYAANIHDLFFAQGYVHAQDRFWQMDFWRHIGSGRLSEMFGDSQLETDAFLRTLGWARLAQREIEGMDAETLKILQSYAEGVNAYLADHRGSAISLEYAILKLLTPDYQPEPWQPLHTLTWAKAMAWNLGGNMGREIERAILLKTLTPEQVAELFPPYRADMPRIVSGTTNGNPQATLSPLLPPTFLTSDLLRVKSRLALLDALLSPSGFSAASNNWVISGQLTASSKPLLANDPHLGVQMPSIWYENALHCTPRGAACPFEVAGFSFPGAPGVVIGHNDHIAWGMTDLSPDVQDLYIEKINPDNPNQYEVNGQWVDMQLSKETIKVGGGEAVEVTVRSTRHGPIISDSYGGLADFGERAGVALPEAYAIALRWTALEPSYIFPAILKVNRAQNWQEFRRALQGFTIAAQNFVYADIEGNIGYQSSGNLPIRAGGKGVIPIPGWTDDYEWTGYIPFEEMPFSFNPPAGYLVTANNAIIGADYPYFISLDWDHGFRASRIVTLITSAEQPIDIPYIQKIQGDNKNLGAEQLTPLLLQISLGDARLEKARLLFKDWDFQQNMDSAPAALFNVFWKHLLADTFHDDLPEDFWPSGGGRWYDVVLNLVKQPNSLWWDDRTTSTVESRDQIFRQAFSEAVDELEDTLGKNPADWKWGDLHTVTFRNQTLGQSGIAPIEALFNRGPYRTAGGVDIVNATGRSVPDNFEVNWLPSMRMIVDFSNLSNSLTIHPVGQSGHAFHPHYADLVDRWRNIQYHPMLWEQEQVEKAASEHLTLRP